MVRRRHRDHFIDRAGASVARWCGPHQAADLARLRGDHPNLIAALAWSVDTPGEAPAGARLAVLLRYHWIAGGFLTYGRRWLERLLERLDPGLPERGHALGAAAWVALIQGDRAVARTYLAKCTGIADALPDRAMQGHAAHWRALLDLFEGDLPAAARLYERAIAIHREVGDVGSELTAAFQLAMAQTYAGRPAEALRTCAAVVERASADGESWNRGYAHWVAAISHLHLGDLPRAEEAVARTMRIEYGCSPGTEMISSPSGPGPSIACAGTCMSSTQGGNPRHAASGGPRTWLPRSSPASEPSQTHPEQAESASNGTRNPLTRGDTRAIDLPNTRPTTPINLNIRKPRSAQRLLADSGQTASTRAFAPRRHINLDQIPDCALGSCEKFGGQLLVCSAHSSGKHHSTHHQDERFDRHSSTATLRRRWNRSAFHTGRCFAASRSGLAIAVKQIFGEQVDERGQVRLHAVGVAGLYLFTVPGDLRPEGRRRASSTWSVPVVSRQVALRYLHQWVQRRLGALVFQEAIEVTVLLIERLPARFGHKGLFGVKMIVESAASESGHAHQLIDTDLVSPLLAEHHAGRLENFRSIELLGLLGNSRHGLPPMLSYATQRRFCKYSLTNEDEHHQEQVGVLMVHSQHPTSPPQEHRWSAPRSDSASAVSAVSSTTIARQRRSGCAGEEPIRRPDSPSGSALVFTRVAARRPLRPPVRHG